jgi:hypothetical protein
VSGELGLLDLEDDFGSHLALEEVVADGRRTAAVAAMPRTVLDATTLI